MHTPSCVRPGHHAQPAQADGYCLFNNIALAAEHARRRGVDRVAILDWDVHHGNGTQECFYDRDDVLTVSLHMRHGAWSDSHPQTGAPDELGGRRGHRLQRQRRAPARHRGRRLPARLRGGRRAPSSTASRPASCSSPAARTRTSSTRTAGNACPWRASAASARRRAPSPTATRGGRVVLAQEGGYARTYSAYCLHATLAGVLGVETGLEDPCAYLPDDPGHADRELASVRAALAPYWAL